MTNYDLPKLRRELIELLAKTLKKGSKFYKEDYDNIVTAVNRKTRKELLESLERQRAINGVTKAEIKRNCQI